MTTERTDRNPDQAETLASDVPRRLRAERERQNISLRELARRLDVSPSAISQIETGRVRPSVAMLYAIVNELDISMDELFDRDVENRPRRDRNGSLPPQVSPVVTEDGRTEIEFGKGVAWQRLTAQADTNVDFLFVTYDPGGSSSPDEHLMRHLGHEYGLILSGSLEVTVGFETYVLGAGDSISFASTTPHRLRNVGDVPATGVWIVLGRQGSGAGGHALAGVADASE
ncbi:MAG TPA: cupin domain-containing protein [Solirubrobacterales bacterium]|nr:cupin domain-containing protein [Solirubrobacterales bacterium]